jgi:DNA-binding CsgD family transcriptional regulator
VADPLFVGSRESAAHGEAVARALAVADRPSSAAAMLEDTVARLFLRALQFVLGGVLFGVAFFPARGRGSALELATAAVLLALALCALARRGALLAVLRRRPSLTLLFPLPALLAVTLDGGFDSVWTPLVAITVGVPATLGLPWLSCGCALVAASGQATAAWINRADKRTPQLVETALFNAVGTIAVGVGIALSVATMGVFLQRRPEILARLREDGPSLTPAPPAGHPAAPEPPQLPPPRRTALTAAELRVVALLADGQAPKEISGDLGIAISTVRSHLKAAKRKAGARTLTELVGLFVTQDGQL